MYSTLVYVKSKKSLLNPSKVEINHKSDSINRWGILPRIIITNLIPMRYEMTEPYSFKKRRPVATATTTTTATRLAAFGQDPSPKIENRIVRTTSTKSRLTAYLASSK